jgi:predicted transcriptional regulator
MALLHQGYRLSEIAKMREITLKTVIKHIKPFIEDGVIDLSDIFPADRKWLR